MSNVIAIARKELRAYFASPIAYVVIGLYAIMFGYFFYALLLYFDRQSMQMAGLGGAQPVNVNEGLIRPVFLNTTVIFLFILPMVTMRTYSEEKRSGTIELLLTSPLTDFQIIAGKFLGAMGLYAAMLAVTIPHIAALFWLGNPEWIPIVVTYLGLLLMGGCFISLGLFMSAMIGGAILYLDDKQRGVHEGYLVTPFGRKRWFFGRRDENDTLKQAVAFLGQSMTADEMNNAMLAVWRLNIASIMLQGHDSILIQYPEEKENEVIPQILQAMRVPLELEGGRRFVVPVECQVGWNWAKASEENPNGLAKYPDGRTRRYP